MMALGEDALLEKGILPHTPSFRKLLRYRESL